MAPGARQAETFDEESPAPAAGATCGSSAAASRWSSAGRDLDHRVLVALLLPAVQSARESARRVQCQNNLHQLGVATQNYHDRHGAYPPGVWQLSFAAAPRYRGVSLFVYLLPYMEQSSLYDRWDFDDPLANTAGGRTSPTAARLPNLICPSDMLQDNPVDAGSGRWYGMTSYGGNGGAQSYDPQFATNDGIFHVIGPGSQTDPSGVPVTMGGVIDGTTNTFLFGERRHFDPNHDTFAAGVTAPSGQFLNPMAQRRLVGPLGPTPGRRRRHAQRHGPHYPHGAGPPDPRRLDGSAGHELQQLPVLQ